MVVLTVVVKIAQHLSFQRFLEELGERFANRPPELVVEFNEKMRISRKCDIGIAQTAIVVSEDLSVSIQKLAGAD